MTGRGKGRELLCARHDGHPMSTLIRMRSRRRGTADTQDGSALLEATFALFILMLTLLPLASLLNTTSTTIGNNRSEVTAIYLANNYLNEYLAQSAGTSLPAPPATVVAPTSPQVVGGTSYSLTLATNSPGWCELSPITGIWGNGTTLTSGNAGYWVVVDVTWGPGNLHITDAGMITFASGQTIPSSTTSCPV